MNAGSRVLLDSLQLRQAIAYKQIWPRRYRGATYDSLAGRKQTFLPRRFWAAHELCFQIHDVLTQALVSGEKQRAFVAHVPLSPSDPAEFSSIDELFSWLREARSAIERTRVLATCILPPLLSDMLHYLYEALETSRKGKLAITYTLLRKPLQEGLALFEAMLAEPSTFVDRLENDPKRLSSKLAGGTDVHAARIEKTLAEIPFAFPFDATYIARLRYDRTLKTGFAAVHDLATHLFTDHKLTQTEPMNVNFIFSGWAQKTSQWNHLYCQLPYLLFYMWALVETIFLQVAPCEPPYLLNMERRISASLALWGRSLGGIEDPEVTQLLAQRESWLRNQCGESRTCLRRAELRLIAATGELPGVSGKDAASL